MARDKHNPKAGASARLLEKIRSGAALSRLDELRLVLLLAVPSVIAQLSTIAMQYIDAAMVGHLGAREAAAVGLVAPTLWLLWGIGSSLTMGFSVQAAHRIGAGDFAGARCVMRSAITVCIAFSALLGAAGAACQQQLPGWLGAPAEIVADASVYLLVSCVTLPLSFAGWVFASMLRACGDMRITSAANVGMCALDVLFNFLLIFPASTWHVAGLAIPLPGAGLGVAGAALGTAAGETLSAIFLLYWMGWREPILRFGQDAGGSLAPQIDIVRRAVQIGAPVCLQRVVMCGAQIASTMIIAPLGTVSVAAHSLAITAESLCYMPGYGISEAATTLVGQATGARRADLVRGFAWLTVGAGALVMAAMGVLLWVYAPELMATMSQDPDVCALGAQVLRIEAWAEPLFAASIVAYGVFVGAGDTLVPSLMNLATMWGVRLALAYLMAPVMGLKGVWTAMCIELMIRGAAFLARMRWGRWQRNPAL